MEHDKTEFTYLQGRKCFNCSDPIADQEHGLRIYCEPFYREDGSVQNCKDDHNSALKKAEMEPFTHLGYFHRDIARQIKQLIAEKGDLVYLSDINTHGIPLDRCLRLERAISGLCTFYFIPYAVQQLSKSEFKIFTHELL